MTSSTRYQLIRHLTCGVASTDGAVSSLQAVEIDGDWPAWFEHFNRLYLVSIPAGCGPLVTARESLDSTWEFVDWGEVPQEVQDLVGVDRHEVLARRSHPAPVEPELVLCEWDDVTFPALRAVG